MAAKASAPPLGAEAPGRVARRFTPEDQAAFAAFSGDLNPLHLDPLRARRTWAGAPVVHGVHLLLWAIDALAAAGRFAEAPVAVRMHFREPLLVGDRAELVPRLKRNGTLAADVCVGETIHAQLEFPRHVLLETAVPVPGGHAPEPTMLPAAPLEVRFAEVDGRAGRLLLPQEATDLKLEHAAVLLGSDRLIALGRMSALVGMLCPGLHSILGSVDVSFTSPRLPWVDYAVVERDPGLQQVAYAVDGAGMRGRIEAYFRTPPIAAPPLADLAGRVSRDEFAGASALVIGGSRGLGAVTAKTLAAGGARVVLTYRVGSAEAAEIRAEVRQAGGECEICRFDVSGGALRLPAGWPAPRHVYYFATPKMLFTRQRRSLSPTLLAKYLEVYVAGLEKIVESLAHATDRWCVFVPSTQAVAAQPSGDGASTLAPFAEEFIMAKAAAERCAADLERRYEGCRIVCYRLPRLRTEQTLTVTAAPAASPVDVMVPLIRGFQAIGS